MSTATRVDEPSFVQLQLRTSYGPVYRNVSTNPPRESRDDEIPLIDVSLIYDDFEARKALAREVKHASEHTGFSTSRTMTSPRPQSKGR